MDKKNINFQIIKDDSTDGHGGFGVGTISLENIAPVIIDVEGKNTYVDLGALHAKSDVEKGIKWIANREEVGNGKDYYVVWVAVERLAQGPAYTGITACYMMINKETRRGYKLLHEHVNLLDKAMKRKVILDQLTPEAKSLLKNFLHAHNEAMWENSSELLRNAFE